ncbi:MAG: polyprenyl synthetase family protein [Planctomycetes bacterium]|nr:polyprenyl synthetase family protein [Planctomycetota bacterium]
MRVTQPVGSANPLVELYRPIHEDLARAEATFEAELACDLPVVRRLCDTVRCYRGKMLRPALLLLSARASGRLLPAHHTLAAVIEMVHMATLVHDDVLDEADERRGQPTVCRASGNTAAVLLGDLLISHAFHLCSSLDRQHASRRIGATTNTVCEGELLQNAHRGDPDVDEAIYLEIIRRKTGVLTATACELGAHYAGADEAAVSALRDYGLSAGMAFQIVDDVLDLVGERERVGKSLGRDAALGKLTLPTLHFLLVAAPADAEKLRRDIRAGAIHDPAELRPLLERAGSIEYALAAARQYVADAVRNLEGLPPSDARSSLTAMAEFIVERQS